MTYVGDVEVNTKPIKDLGIAADQYDSVNKLFLSVKTNGKIIDELNFSVKGMSNTFYTILVTLLEIKMMKILSLPIFYNQECLI